MASRNDEDEEDEDNDDKEENVLAEDKEQDEDMEEEEELVSSSSSSSSSPVGTEAASVHVQAGHFDDTIPGLAHFHEHMLFLGTQKYPSEEEYESYLSQFGGFSNAYTDMEDTNYYFSIVTSTMTTNRAAVKDETETTTDATMDPTTLTSTTTTTSSSSSTNSTSNSSTTSPALAGALDRLSQFFIRPTFARDAVDREVQAIDSEYRNSKTSDAWRNFQLLKATCHPEHPFAKFGCGNKETLTSLGTERLLDELERFWQTYYQTYNLRLSVVGHASLDALQQTVEETFGQLPYSEGPPRRIQSRPGQFFSREHAVYGGSPAFGPAQLAKMRRIVPFTELRTIKVYFATPPLDDPQLQASKPYRVLSHILGHEAPGSLHDVLNGMGYLVGLSSGVGVDTTDFSLFTLTLSLTPKGMQHKEEVLDRAFEWIALIRQHKDRLAGYHDELRQISTMNFRFRENGDPVDFCSAASELLFDEVVQAHPERILIAPSETTEHLDPAVMDAMLDRLRPSNCMVSILDPDLKQLQEAGTGDWKAEPWYGAQYLEEDLTPEQIQAWEAPDIDPRLVLPALNNYIPSDFSLRCDDEKHKTTTTTATTGELDDEASQLDNMKQPPNLLVHRPDLRLWHKMDRYWRVPKTSIKIAILSSKIYQTPRTMTLSRIFQRVLNDDLNSFVYDASIAGCSYRVSCAPYGYRISVRGYSEKLPFLLDTLTTRILSLIDEMKDGTHVALQDRFFKAKESLLRETKNYRLDPPHEVANYNSRLMIEEHVWYLDNYIDEMEGSDSERFPLTMKECAQVAEECLMGRVKCEALCMGNIDEDGALEVASVIDRHFLNPGRTLSEVETPRFRSLKLPTRAEATMIFGPAVKDRKTHLVYQDVAYSDSEENNSVELILQAGSEFELGYEGVAILDLICHMAYNSAFSQLRTKEQLGYLVSAHARKTAGAAWGMSIVVQSSVALPEILEERCEAWLEIFRNELEQMSPESMAMEASAVVSQLLESETKLSQEVSRVFGEILSTEGMSDRMRDPAFDRLLKLANELTIAEDDETASKLGQKTAKQLKERVLSFFDKHLAPDAPERRTMSARVYNQKAKDIYDAHVGQPGILSTYSDMRHYKQYLSSWPSVPYWRNEGTTMYSTPVQSIS